MKRSARSHREATMSRSTGRARSSKKPTDKNPPVNGIHEFVTDDKDAATGSDVEREAHRVFVEEYMANGGNATRAYLAAYPRCRSENAAAVNGRRLLRKTQIQAAIRERQSADPRIASREEIQRFWSDQLYDESIEWSQRNRASELLAKSLGMFVEQVEARSDVRYHYQWDTDEEPARPSQTSTQRQSRD